MLGPAAVLQVASEFQQLLSTGCQCFAWVRLQCEHFLAIKPVLQVTSVFQQMAATNTSVLRTWAFNDYTNFTGPSLQPELGTLNVSTLA